MTVGTQGCWVVTIDLTGASDRFDLDGDGETIFDGASNLDNFGYTFNFSGHGTDTSTGPLIFGDPALSPMGDGTTNFGFGPGPDGTGLGQEDAFYVATQLLAGPGCYNFGSYPSAPWGGFYMRLMGDADGGSSSSAYCVPGGANSVSAGGGVLTSTGGYGTAAATFDITDVPNQPGILYSGANQIQLPFGCGERCVAGNNIRGPAIIPSGNQISTSFDMSGPNPNIQYWYRDPANFANCGSAFNLTNALNG